MKLPERKWLLIDRWPRTVTIAKWPSDLQLVAIIAAAVGETLFTTHELAQMAQENGGDLGTVFKIMSPTKLGKRLKKIVREGQSFDGLAIKRTDGREGNAVMWSVGRV